MTAAERTALWIKWGVLYEQGQTLEEIADATNATWNRVWYGLQCSGVTMRSTGYRSKSRPQFLAPQMESCPVRISRMEELAYRIAKRKVRLCS